MYSYPELPDKEAPCMCSKNMLFVELCFSPPAFVSYWSIKYNEDMTFGSTSPRQYCCSSPLWSQRCSPECDWASCSDESYLGFHRFSISQIVFSYPQYVHLCIPELLFASLIDGEFWFRYPHSCHQHFESASLPETQGQFLALDWKLCKMTQVDTAHDGQESLYYIDEPGLQCSPSPSEMAWLLK